jgi:succinate dehydrogenase iron-sulfur subunit
MTTKNIVFKISRHKPGAIDQPRFFEYAIPVTETMTVLDCLENIRLEQEASLMYRHSCHHSSCGTCACIINGKEKLACTTNVQSLETDTVTLEPLAGFSRMGDLAVDMTSFFYNIEEDWPHLQPAEALGEHSLPLNSKPFERFENCIECGSCVSACPVSREGGYFMGPAALSALHRDILKSPAKEKTLLNLAAKKEGAPMCKRALACSRVCPTAVYPAGHIANLKKKLSKK